MNAPKVRRYTLKQAAKPQKQYKVRYDEELNQEQLEVVMAGEGPMLVIAGAGSGKTRTLTYRVSRLIEDGIDPSEILIVTFTNKAAREMLSRVGVGWGQSFLFLKKNEGVTPGDPSDAPVKIGKVLENAAG